MSPESVSAIEKGQSCPPQATRPKIPKALGRDFAAFFVDSAETRASSEIPGLDGDIEVCRCVLDLSYLSTFTPGRVGDPFARRKESDEE